MGLNVVGLFKNGAVSHASRLGLLDMITGLMETHRHSACRNYPKFSETQCARKGEVNCDIICTVLGLVTK
jgi:hypothetical protein